MAIIAKAVPFPQDWYEHVTDELVVLHGYVKDVERLIAESIEIYRRDREEHVIEENPEEGWIHTIITHHGIDDSNYDLDSIFKEYFPNLQRRSALITLFSFFEHQLDDLCRGYKKEKGFALSFTDLTGNGIDRSTLYLKKVAGLSLNNGTATWREIKNIQNVRNAIVHNGGEIKDDDTKMRDYCRKHGLLSGESQLSIKAEYLLQVINTFAEYFREIHKVTLSNT
jgi:hypothetical protein